MGLPPGGGGGAQIVFHQDVAHCNAQNNLTLCEDRTGRETHGTSRKAT